MGNRPEFIWTHLGGVFIGALSVPVNTSQRGATLEHILADSDSVAMVCDDELRDAVLATEIAPGSSVHPTVASVLRRARV